MIEYSRRGFKIRATQLLNGIRFGGKLCLTKRGAKKDLEKMLEKYGGLTNEETASVHKRSDNKQGKL